MKYQIILTTALWAFTASVSAVPPPDVLEQVDPGNQWIPDPKYDGPLIQARAALNAALHGLHGPVEGEHVKRDCNSNECNNCRDGCSAFNVRPGGGRGAGLCILQCGPASNCDDYCK